MNVQAEDGLYYSNPQFATPNCVFGIQDDELCLAIKVLKSELSCEKQDDVNISKKFFRIHKIKAEIQGEPNTVNQVFPTPKELGVITLAHTYHVRLKAPIPVPQVHASEFPVHTDIYTPYGWTISVPGIEVYKAYTGGNTVGYTTLLKKWLGVDELKDLQRALRKASGLTAPRIKALKGEETIRLQRK